MEGDRRSAGASARGEMLGFALSRSCGAQPSCCISVPPQSVQGAPPGRAHVPQPRRRAGEGGPRRAPDPRGFRMRIRRHCAGRPRPPFVCRVISGRGEVLGGEGRITGASCRVPSTTVGGFGVPAPTGHPRAEEGWEMAARGSDPWSGVPESIRALGTRLGARTWSGRGRRKDLGESAPPSLIHSRETEA